MFAKPVSPLLEIGARGTEFAKWLSEFIRKKTSGLPTVLIDKYLNLDKMCRKNHYFHTLVLGLIA